MQKNLSILLVLILILGFMPIGAHATEASERQTVITFEDGSYIEVHLNEDSSRATNTKSGSKTYSYYDANDNREWQAKLSASFTYDGTTSSCSSASCTVTIYESQWYEVSKTTTRSGNTATTELTMGQTFWGITIAKPEYTITLTCDKDGNLS